MSSSATASALAKDGILMVVVSVDRETGQIVSGPDIVTRGFVYAKDESDLLEGVKRHLRGKLRGIHQRASDQRFKLPEPAAARLSSVITCSRKRAGGR